MYAAEEVVAQAVANSMEVFIVVDEILQKHGRITRYLYLVLLAVGGKCDEMEF